MLAHALVLVFSFGPAAPGSSEDDDKIDVREVVSTFEDAFDSELAAERVAALEELQKAQVGLEKPDARITKAIGTGFKDEDLDVKAACALQLRVAHDPGEAIKLFERGMKVAAKDLASYAFDDKDHARCQAWLKTLFESVGVYRDDRAQKLLLRFFEQQRMILHGDALQTLAQALLDYGSLPALEALLEYQEMAEKSGFSHLLRKRLRAGLGAAAKEREIDAPPEKADGGTWAFTLGRWLKKNARHFDKKLGRLEEPRRAS